MSKAGFFFNERLMQNCHIQSQDERNFLRTLLL